MKTQSILKTILLAAGFSVVALMGNATAQIVVADPNAVINVQMGYQGQLGEDMNGTADGPTAAPLAYNGTTWNVYTGVNNTSAVNTGSDLLYSTGALSTVGFTVGFADVAQDQGPQTLTLLDNLDYHGSTPNPETLTLTGLKTDGTAYNFVLADTGAGFFNFTITNGTQSDTMNLSTNNSTWVDGQNYVELNNLIPNGSGVITITGTEGSDGYIALSGFQLAEVPVVPEPSTYALMGLGALALLIVSRHRRTA